MQASVDRETETGTELAEKHVIRRSLDTRKSVQSTTEQGRGAVAMMKGR